MKHRDVHVVSAAIIRDTACLVVQRGPRMSYSGRWELPGGKVKPGEPPREALKREMREELEVEVFVGPLIVRGQSHPGARDFVVEIYEACLTGGPPRMLEHSQHCWLDADELEALEWAEHYQPIISTVVEYLRSSRPTWLELLPGPARRQGAQLAGTALAWGAASFSCFVTMSAVWGAFYSSGLATQRAALENALQLARLATS